MNHPHKWTTWSTICTKLMIWALETLIDLFLMSKGRDLRRRCLVTFKNDTRPQSPTTTNHTHHHRHSIHQRTSYTTPLVARYAHGVCLRIGDWCERKFKLWPILFFFVINVVSYSPPGDWIYSQLGGSFKVNLGTRLQKKAVILVCVCVMYNKMI